MEERRHLPVIHEDTQVNAAIQDAIVAPNAAVGNAIRAGLGHSERGDDTSLLVIVHFPALAHALTRMPAGFGDAQVTLRRRAGPVRRRACGVAVPVPLEVDIVGGL